MTEPEPLPPAEEKAQRARHAETMVGLRDLLGYDLLVEVSQEVRHALTWHEDPEHDHNTCICPAMIAYALLYEHGFGVMPISAIRQAVPLLQQVQDLARTPRSN